VVYDCGPAPGHRWDDFDAVRARLASEWDALPRTADVTSGPLRTKIAAVVAAGPGGGGRG
jgi:nicotinamide phosphoribosyltransferase